LKVSSEAVPFFHGREKKLVLFFFPVPQLEKKEKNFFGFARVPTTARERERLCNDK